MAIGYALSMSFLMGHHGPVTVERFADRLELARFADDPRVGVFDCGSGAEGETWVPERLWRRLNSIGVAYELHQMGRLVGGSEPVVLNSTQTESLVEELNFIGELVADPLLREQIRALTAVMPPASRSGADGALRIEGD